MQCRAVSQSGSQQCAEHRTGERVGTSIFSDSVELGMIEVFLPTSYFKKKLCHSFYIAKM